MFEIVGQIVVGLFATAVIVIVLQLALETVLSFFGFWRFWRIRRRTGITSSPFPFWWAVWAALRWKLELSGWYQIGAMRVPCDPREPLGRDRYPG